MREVFQQIAATGMIAPGERVLVGVSGGADSLCLLLVLCDYQKVVPFALLAVHVEHGIRGEAGLADARFVEQFCQARGIPCRVVSRAVPALAAQRGWTLEEAGRVARYEAFEQVRKEEGAEKVAVAHHMEDVAETVLFHLARGSGVGGACGIPPVRGSIIRPLLSVERRKIEAYLKERNIPWREDATNAELGYARNRIRHQVLPTLQTSVNQGATRHLAAFAEEMRGVWAYLSRQAKEATDAVATCTDGAARIAIPLFLQVDAALQPLCLRECLVRAGCGLKNITRAQIEGIRGLFFGQSGRQVSLPGGWVARRQFNIVEILRWQDATQQVAISENPHQAVFPGNLQDVAQQSAQQGIRPCTKQVALTDALHAKQVPHVKELYAKQGLPSENPHPSPPPCNLQIVMQKDAHMVASVSIPTRQLPLSPWECVFCGERFLFRVFSYKNNEKILQKTYTKWFDYDKIKANLTMRTRQAGDFLQINSQGQRKTLKRYLIEEKVPQSARGRVALLAEGSEVLWVVGHRISEAYKVTQATKNVLEVKLLEMKRTGGDDGRKSDGNVGGKGH